MEEETITFQPDRLAMFQIRDREIVQLHQDRHRLTVRQRHPEKKERQRKELTGLL